MSTIGPLYIVGQPDLVNELLYCLSLTWHPSLQSGWALRRRKDESREAWCERMDDLLATAWEATANDEGRGPCPLCHNNPEQASGWSEGGLVGRHWGSHPRPCVVRPLVNRALMQQSDDLDKA